MTHDRGGLTEREVSLVEILDRALGCGVVVTGDLTLSLADIDLVYLDLRLVLGSVGTLYDAPGRADTERALNGHRNGEAA
jgi:hypothetical protein